MKIAVCNLFHLYLFHHLLISKTCALPSIFASPHIILIQSIRVTHRSHHSNDRSVCIPTHYRTITSDTHMVRRVPATHSSLGDASTRSHNAHAARLVFHLDPSHCMHQIPPWPDLNACTYIVSYSLHLE